MSQTTNGGMYWERKANITEFCWGHDEEWKWTLDLATGNYDKSNRV